ncbi:hypothetical protein CCU22_02340 [Candidatus Legionella polyplacis]|uniref:hypothetical protein n=1 Tax=Candidatus Legionella polyplacis TaxID=2005262 RepID=UPI000C1EE200|nr:hypothetical protein [Candidatus Legionella polyplacis]ATW02020.1 hypothetical protein CCU22_02340 [Candidatus Legionella polyplacis]
MVYNRSSFLKRIIDFINFGLHNASMYPLCFGHGTSNIWDDILLLVLGTLNLPLSINPIILQTVVTFKEKKKFLTI